MEYILSFLEGILTFISPCILPMFPIYLSYFAGNTGEEDLVGDTDQQDAGVSPNENVAKGKKGMPAIFKNVLGFALGFTLVFISLGAFAGSVGVFLFNYSRTINIVTGIIVILFGLHFTGLLNIGFLNRSSKMNFKQRKLGFFSSVLFGIIFSIGWSPCVGVFLGSALMLAANQGSVWQGTLMLLFYSLGLSIPFILSAIFIERLKSAFIFIKKHYKIINLISGIILILIGITMALGWFDTLMGLLTF